MSVAVPRCRSITVSLFGGDRSRPFASAILAALDDERTGRGPGPSSLQCLLFTGHAGVSLDDATTIHGFNPDPGPLPLWRVMDGLRSGDAFPGVVRDDTAVFAAAARQGSPIRSFAVVVPEPVFLRFETELDAERRNSQYSYGFPDGDGDCNCVTWLERLGLPLLTGRMDEFLRLSGVAFSPSRRFGECL